MAAPDFIEPVVGWRLWLPVETHAGVRLQSIFHRTAWLPCEALRAVCLARRPPPPLRRLLHCCEHMAPDARCCCGVHAGRPDWLLDHLRGSPGRYVIGRVLLWGRVVECESGWRAELAYPERLYVAAADNAPSIASGLSAYLVPVEVSAGVIPERLRSAA